MGYSVRFLAQGREDYEYWSKTDKSKVKKIQKFIKECCLTPFEGLGKPEPLKNNWSGWWSRRINLEHRFVYRIVGDSLEIAQCRHHYEK